MLEQDMKNHWLQEGIYINQQWIIIYNYSWTFHVYVHW
jgi:plasmid maintenance system killer protein